MPSFIQSAFSTGEMAPEYHGRSDLGAVYQHGLKRSLNFHVLPQGGVTRRPGTRYVAAAKNGVTTITRFAKMIPTSSTVYVLEMGPTYIRFYRNRAAVLSMGVPYEVATPYAAGEVQTLSFTAYQRQLWIWHPNHPPAILQWGGSDTAWALNVAGFTDGPYLDPVQNSTTLTPDAAGANTATLTASGLTGINGGIGFQPGDVGRLIRLKQQPLGLIQLAITAGGSGYQVGDVIKPTVGSGQQLLTLGGDPLDAFVTVTAVSSGAVTAARITVPGQYVKAPSTSFTQALTSGSGSGFTATATYGPQSDQVLWSWGIIEARHSTTSIDVTLQASEVAADGTTQNLLFVATTAIATWRLGAWGGQEGYPAIGGATFQERLLCGAMANYPKRVFASELPQPGTSEANFLSMSPTLVNGQVVDSNAITFDVDDPQGDAICWISPCGNAETAQIGIGTGNAEHIVQPGAQAQALSPLSLQTYLVTKYTSAPLPPLRVGKFLLFVDRSFRRLREWMYYFMAGGFVGPEASPYGKHLLLPGIGAYDYALAPHPTIWQAMQNGSLAGLSYMPEQSIATTPKENISAWHSHRLGGSFFGAAPYVESLVVVPDENGGDDQVWLSVARVDSGGSSKTIEVSTPYFRSMPVDQAVFVDGAVSSALTYPATTCVPVLADAYLPSGEMLPQRGDSASFAFTDAVALPDDGEAAVLRINGGTFLVQTVGDANNVTCLCLDAPRQMGASGSSGWSYDRMRTSFSGFAVFNNRTVTVYADGQPQGSQVVQGGIVTLTAPASYVTVGYHAKAVLDTLDLDLPVPDGSSQIKTGSLDHLYVRFFETIGGAYGQPGRVLDAIPPRQEGDIPSWAPRLRGTVSGLTDIDDDDELNDGDVRVAFPGGSSTHRHIRIEQNDPWPMTVLAVLARGGTTELSPK